MERKIGEIFEFGGEWYQCINTGNCSECAFTGKRCYDFSTKGVDIIGNCTGRTFKKLEKVGEPYYSKYYGKFYQKYITYIPAVGYNFKVRIEPVEHVSRTEIYVELKQKEDMEEKKLNLKPFNLEEAKAGKPVCTRDGRKARIICFDGKGDQPIIALVEAKGNKDALIEEVERFFINGHSVFEVSETNNDLMMLPEKKEGWAVIRKSDIYETEEQAKEVLLNSRVGVMIRKINWEE